MTQGKRLYREFSESLLTRDADRFAEMFLDEHSVLEYPYPPPGQVEKLEGKETIREYARKLPEIIQFNSFSEPLIHETADSSVIVIECTCEAIMITTGKPYNQSYVCVIHMKGGKITLFKDYWNPLVAIDAMGESYPVVK